jgi:Protein of unknown function (DUF4019)
MYSLLRGRQRPTIFALLVLALIFTAGNPAYAQNQDQSLAEESASQFWYSYDRGDLSTLYKSLSKAFRDQITETQFVQQVGMARIQAGGAAFTRTLVGAQSVNSPPGFPGGDYFYVRYRARYPNGDVFQDTMFTKETATWHLYSFNVLAAPSAPSGQ